MERDDNSNMNMGLMRGGAPITGVLGTVLGGGAMLLALAAGGMGLFGGGRNERGQNIQDRLAAVEMATAVNTANDQSTQELMAALIDNAKKDAKIEILESERRLDNRIDNLQIAVVNNAGTIKCVQDNLNSLTQIGIPSANIITPPSATTATSTAGA